MNLIPTEEQLGIMTQNNSVGKKVRVIAGAGTGKTSTLVLLAEELVKRKENDLYLVFNKKAQLDAEKRFQNSKGTIHCHTLHSAALQNIIADSNFDGFDNIVDDSTLRKQISKKLSSTIEDWLRTKSPFARYSSDHGTEKNRKKLRLDIETVSFWIYKTLDRWMRSSNAESALSDIFTTYYPAKCNHKKYFGFSNFGKFYIENAVQIWEQIWTGQYAVTHDAFMKYAQLGNCNLQKYTTILLDESQDTTACQLDLFVKQQADKNIYVVGDAMQTIYSFRGAKSKFVVELPNTNDHTLTKSFRFGSSIAKIANRFLWIKEYSPQAHLFNPYRLTGVGVHEGVIARIEDSLEFPYTLIARTNHQLISSSLELLASNENILIAINGDIAKFQTSIKKVLDLYNLYLGDIPERDEYKKYETWDEFVDEVQKLERTDEILLISLIEIYKERLPNTMKRFKEMVLDKKVNHHDADVILSTGFGN